MSTHYTEAETDLASRLYSEFVGYDLAQRLPLRCTGPWMQRQWLAVARLAIELVEADLRVAVDQHSGAGAARSG